MDPFTYCRIESLNAQAIQLIATGSYAEASKGLSCALRELLPHVLDPQGDDSFNGIGDTDNLVLQCVPLCPPDSSASKVEERIFSVFSHAIFYARCDTDCAWRLEDYRRAAAATVYNMALASHYQGLQERPGQIRQAFLDKALKAYAAARNVVEAVADEDEDGVAIQSSSEDVKFLLLAIANNEGHVYEQLSLLDEARDCLCQLHSILPRTSRTEEFGQFLVTAILFPRPDHLSLHAPVA